MYYFATNERMLNDDNFVLEKFMDVFVYIYEYEGVVLRDVNFLSIVNSGLKWMKDFIAKQLENRKI